MNGTHRLGVNQDHPCPPLPAVQPARGLTGKVIRVPCIIRPLTESPGIRQEGAFPEFKLRYRRLYASLAAHTVARTRATTFAFIARNSRT